MRRPSAIRWSRDEHDPVVDLFDHLWPHCHAPSADGLGVGHLGPTDPGEIAVHQIGARLPFQHAVAPVAHVLEHQQTQHHLGRGARPAAGAALGMPLGQGLVHGRHDFLVRQYLIGVFHPLRADPSLRRRSVRHQSCAAPVASQSRFFLLRLGVVSSGRNSAWLSELDPENETGG
jgi:hypothetical protein